MGLGFRAWGLQGLEFRVYGVGFRVRGVGLRVIGLLMQFRSSASKGCIVFRYVFCKGGGDLRLQGFMIRVAL